MKVKDIMTANLLTLHVSQTISDAACMFTENRIDYAPIVDSDGKLEGVITKSKVLGAVLRGESLERSISDVMENQYAYVEPDRDIEDLLDLGAEWLPVLDHGHLLGAVTLSDLAGAYYHSVLDLKYELEAVIGSVHNAILSVDDNGIVQIFNPAAEKIFGIEKSKVIGRPLTNILPQSNLSEIVKTGRSEYSQKLAFNNRTLLSNRTPISVNGKIAGAVAVLQDISELENISLELKSTKELKEELDAIFNSSFDGIYVTDGRGVTLRINDAYSRITGIQREEVLGRSMAQLVKEGVFDQSVTLLVMERLEQVTITQAVRTGKSVLATGTPIFNERGELFRVVTNVRDLTELESLREKLQHAEGLSQTYEEQLSRYKLLDKYIIRSQKTRDLIDLVLRLGQVDSSVLIMGESGVGKEVVAEILHSNGLRREKPLVRINCGAIPENLLESELFGYEDGAFTGAKKGGKKGIFEIADQGTLLLDEIGELPFSLQVKLLRVIQEKEIVRIGGTKPIKVDVRLIAATNRDLWEMVAKNLFRKDLFYRLNVVPVTVPPLRERKEEIPVFAAHFMHRFNRKYGMNKRLDQVAIDKLIQYDWPGNVRELENVIERIVVTNSGDVISDIMLSDYDKNDLENDILEKNLPPINQLKSAVESMEKHMIFQAMNKHGSTRKAAAVLGVSQPTIVRKAARYGIDIRNKKN